MSKQTIFPALRYRDAAAAVTWLAQAFGFQERNVHRAPDGSIAHAELALDGSLIMLGQLQEDGGDYAEVAPPPGHSSLYVVVGDPDAHHARARAAGAPIVIPPEDKSYGAREYTARDPDGNVWSFGTYDPWSTG